MNNYSEERETWMCDVWDRGYCCLGETSGCVFPLPAARVMCCAAWALLLVIRSKHCDEICREARILTGEKWDSHWRNTFWGWTTARSFPFDSEKEGDTSVVDTTYQVPGWLRTTLCDSSVFYSFPTCDFGAASTILLDTSLKLHSHSLKSSLYPKGVD